ncbi:MAG: DEAD/DEAH box helicase family protein [Dehalococcoidia bacterium]|nr:DEAD/DEAH box helicase family protein [Dehalococcoidia bacterium]
MIELRDYQKDLIEQVNRALRPDRARVMMQLPTGGGKTVIAAHLLKARLAEGHKAVWLTHRKELVSQTMILLNEAADVWAWVPRKWDPGQIAQASTGGVVILMAQTVGRRSIASDVWNRYDHNDLMFIDEAHHATAAGYTRAMECWRGRIIGMTATPWRLSVREGFDHLFDNLVCGPQMVSLQEENFLCKSRVVVPAPEQRIEGGRIGDLGDYTEVGIERANMGHQDIMTAGVIRFWERQARGRQTIVYAVSVRHARNLQSVFEESGIPTGIMLGDTPQSERYAAVVDFSRGNLKVLVNVAVATEGFDLPDASCVVIARPTRSLALYLQMLGRGLRPKTNGGDCLILDLAGNSILHGIPEERREWSLAPRGQPPEGEVPVIWCEHCNTASPAASHNCQHCGAEFGDDCGRCGKWRVRNRWVLVEVCEEEHDVVCDLCHRDAHIQNFLPVLEEMEELAGSETDNLVHPSYPQESQQSEQGQEMPPSEGQLDQILDNVLRRLIDEERQRIIGPREARKDELRQFIAAREIELEDDVLIDTRFEEYLQQLPLEDQPESSVEKYMAFNPWWDEFQRELADGKAELDGLELQPIDEDLVLARSKARVLNILSGVSESATPIVKESMPTVAAAGDDVKKVLDIHPIHTPSSRFGGSVLRDSGWVPITELDEPTESTAKRPDSLRLPSGEEVRLRYWRNFLVEIANYLIREGKLNRRDCPVPLDSTAGSYLIHSGDGGFTRSRELANGTYIYTNMGSERMIKQAVYLLRRFGEDPSRFFIRLN